MPARHKGFTLIELLVVISIIALLVGILLPALGAARKTAQKIQCLSNEKQMGIGLVAYAADNRDSLPWGALVGSPQTEWGKMITAYIQGKSLTDTGFTVGTGNDLEIFSCPSAAIDAGSKHYIAHPVMLPSYNQVTNTPTNYGSGGVPHPYKTNRARRTSELMLVTDGAQRETDSSSGPGGEHAGDTGALIRRLDGWGSGNYGRYARDSANWYYKPLQQDVGPYPNDEPIIVSNKQNKDGNGMVGTIRRRHAGDTAAFLFLDGHGESRPIEDILRRNIRPDE